jgi:hypothetical protein
MDTDPALTTNVSTKGKESMSTLPQRFEIMSENVRFLALPRDASSKNIRSALVEIADLLQLLSLELADRIDLRDISMNEDADIVRNAVMRLVHYIRTGFGSFPEHTWAHVDAKVKEETGSYLPHWLDMCKAFLRNLLDFE